MDCKAKKYLHIHDWNYWWGYYRCCKDWEPFHAAEFSFSEDEAGKAPFFHFDFHNLPALHQTILDGEFVEPDNPDHPHFLEQARRLRSGEQDWFVGALYYPLFSPEMHFCNASVRSGVCFFNLALFAGHKLSLSMDAAYIHAYYPNGFNIFNELPLHLCNINLFLIPLGVWKRNRSIMGFSFFVAPLGALMALLFPEPLFSGFSLLLPRIFGYYVTHAVLVVCGLSLATLGFYRPDPKDIPRILKTFGLLAVGAHLINLLLRLTLCPEANYFFTYGAEISVLKLFWRIIPVPLLYELPAPLILAGYMYAVCALSRLTQRAEEVPFS